MDDINKTYKKVGYALLIVGILDICLMILAISNKQGYSSSLNIFAVVAGILLIKGGVKTARVVRWFSAFILSASLLLLPLIPVMTPIDLLAIQFKLNTSGALLSIIFTLVLLGFIFWVYKQLSNNESLAALELAGYKTSPPKSAVIIVVVMFALGGMLSTVIFTGESATKAKQMALDKYGSDFKYHLSSMQLTGEHGSAELTAYNNEMVKYVNVSW